MASQKYAGTKECKDCKALINKKATKCSECGSEQRLWRYLSQSLAQNLFNATQIIILIIGFTLTIQQINVAVEQLETTQTQMKEIARLTWMDGLDNRAFELDKLVIDKPTLGCIYEQDVPALKEGCLIVLKERENLQSAMEYVEVILEHFREVDKYSMRLDKDYYNMWYTGWAADLAKDPHGIVRYVILNYIGCKNKCVFFAKKFQLCPDNISDEECEMKLKKGSDFFIETHKK